MYHISTNLSYPGTMSKKVQDTYDMIVSVTLSIGLEHLSYGV